MNYNKTGDVELMAAVRKGDIAALGELVKRHQDKVLSLAYRFLGRWDRAEDVCQETFLRIWKASHNYSPKAKFTTWLYTIAKNLCLDQQRSMKHEAIPLHQLKIDPEGKSDSDDCEKKELVASIQKAVSSLNERQRLCVIMHRFNGLCHTEISEITGWSKSAVESLLVRAYAHLREQLRDVKEFME